MTPSSNSRKRPTVLRWLRRALVPLFLAALAYVCYGILTRFDEVVAAVSKLPWTFGVMGLAAALATVGARAAYRLALYELAGYGPARLPTRIALQSFAWGQLLRYLPGKVSGPASEAVMLEQYLPWKALLRVTIFETFAMMFLSVFWIVASGLYLAGLPWGALLFWAGGILLTWYLHHRRPWLRHGADIPELATPKAGIFAVSMLVAEWIFFYLVWITVAGSAWFVSATAYVAASLAAVVVLVAPAGLGVRELVFTELMPHLATIDKGEVLGQAIILRVILTAADVLLPLGMLAVNRGLLNDR